MDDILSWDTNKDSLLFDNLKYLLRQGRADNQLVIISMEKAEEISEIRDRDLYDICIANSHFLPMAHSNY